MQNRSLNEILVFKTNIRYKKQVNEIGRHIETEPQIIKWNVDLNDTDKILRIESSDLKPEIIESIIPIL